MGHVAQGIDQLRVRQGTSRPVGEAAALVQFLAQHLADQLFIADLIAESGGHGGDLGVEHRLGHGAQAVEDFDVLTGGVEDLDDRFVAQQGEEGLQVQILGQGVDDRGVRGRSGLDQAQLGPVGRLAHELGVDRDERGLGQPFTELD
ncbi:hypothetical protein D3C72_1141470 [compost metagenome]